MSRLRESLGARLPQLRSPLERRQIARMRLERIACAALGLLVSVTAADGQIGSELRYTQEIEALCRQYAAAVSGTSSGAMFNQCMSERHCEPVASTYLYRCEMPGPLSWHGGGY
jgi:hypothetical protein